MSNAAAIATRAFPVRSLDAALHALAVGAEVQAATPAAPWLREVGVVVPSRTDRLSAHPDWLDATLPAASLDDLVLRTLLRDPLYRLRLDRMLAAICSEIGISGRWARLEELLTGPLRGLSPRIASLLPSRTLEGQDPLDETWTAFDERCWGLAGSPEVLFPILAARLAVVAGTPIFLSEPDELTAELTAAAVLGEGIVIESDRSPELDAAAQRGVPLWRRELRDEQVEAALVLPVRVPDSNPSTDQRRPFSLGVSTAVRSGCRMLTSSPRGRNLWAAVDGKVKVLAFTGVVAGERWPEADVCSIRGLPPRQDMLGLARSRQVQPDPSDAALLMLSEHPLYGLWLQVLLLEALDRELGEETLVIAPPVQEQADLEGASRVLYRPRLGSARNSTLMHDLGPLDRTFDRIAATLDVSPVNVVGPALGPWSLGLRVLCDVEAVQAVRDRWLIAPFVLDRLHSGGLMTSIIRRGKALRERIHDALSGLWAERQAGQEAHNV